MTGFAYNAVDLIALGLIAWEIIMGLRRKMAGELFRLLCTALVLAAGWRYYLDVGNQLAEHTRLAANLEMAQAIAFGMIVAMLGMSCALLHLILGLLIQAQFHALIDRVGGAVLGLLRGSLLVIMLLFAAALWPQALLRETFQQDSCAGRITARLAPPAIRFLRAIKFDFQPDTPAGEESRAAAQTPVRDVQSPAD